MSKTFYSKNPATLEQYGPFEAKSPEEVLAASEKAQKAFVSWSQLSIRERAKYLLKAREYILDHLDEIAQVISEDNGKPRLEALSTDIFPICDLLSYFAKNAEKLLKPESVGIGLMALLGRRSKIHYLPFGVVAIISPWNFPFSIPMGGIAMALVAGNTVLLKAADATPRVGFKIEEVWKAAGLPEGVFQHLPGGVETGEAVLQSKIDKVLFTGSVKVGKRVMEACSQRLIPCSLELGGKDAMIVCEDAPLELAVSAALWGGFCNAGQICASVERIYIHEKIAQEFTNRLVEKVKKLKQGIGSSDYEVTQGPLTTEAQLRVVETQMKEAKEKGAVFLTGGKKNENFPGYFFEPTVITNVDHSFRCVMDETFGPTLPIMTFKNEEEAIKLANDSPYGLCGSVWTKDIKRGRKIALQIRAGTVCVNECTYTHGLPQTPWGGVKDSGFGRNHSKIGLHELVHIQHIHENYLPLLKNFWWFGYDKNLYETLKYLTKHYSGSVLDKIKAVFKIVLELRKKKA